MRSAASDVAATHLQASPGRTRDRLRLCLAGVLARLTASLFRTRKSRLIREIQPRNSARSRRRVRGARGRRRRPRMAAGRVKNSRILTIARRGYSALHTARKTYEQPRTTPSKRDEPAKCAWRCGRVPRSRHVTARQLMGARLPVERSATCRPTRRVIARAINGSLSARHACAPTIRRRPPPVRTCVCMHVGSVDGSR